MTRRRSYWSSAQEAFRIPPGETVEQVVEPGTCRGLRLLEGTAEGLGREQAIRLQSLRGTDQVAPDGRRHLVGGIAAKTLYAEVLQRLT